MPCAAVAQSGVRGRDGRTLRPSELQSEMGHPWSRVENGQAPLLMCLYQPTRGPGQSSLTCLPKSTLCWTSRARAVLQY